MQHHRFVHHLRSAMLAVAGASFVAPAAAQDAAAPPQAPATVQGGSATEEIVVTGSRIRRTNLTNPTPITVLGTQDVQLSGRNNIADVINQLPQATTATGFTPTNTNFSVNSTGLNLISLRNLGTKRTLTLVNGRRGTNSIFSDPDFGGFDVNLVPADLIDRVEVITGGASAVYGSDAVAGVVNIILKEKFEGLRVHTQFGISDRGDGENYDASVTMGANFAGGRGNVTLHVGYDRTREVESKDRDLSRTDTVFTGGQVLRGPPAFSDFTPQGVFYPLNADPVTVLGNGQAVPYSKLLYGYDRNPQRLILVPQDRMLVVPRVRYDVTDDVTFFFDGTIARSRPHNRAEPIAYGLGQTVGFGPTATPILIPTNNPFIPAAIRSLLTPDDEANGGIDFSKRGVEFGNRVSSVTRQLWQGTMGFQGNLPWINGWKWDASYTYGRLTQDQTDTGVFDNEHLFNALNVEADPTRPGSFRCVDATARAQGCVPVNLFGPNSITGPALNYLNTVSQYRGANTLQDLQLNVSGDVPGFRLPAGAISVAAGFEYRRETSKFTPDLRTASGLTSGNQTSPVDGSYDVKEGYVEALAPLLKNLPFVNYFGLEGAFRTSYYSTSGHVDTWKYGAEYRPIEDLRFRTIVSRAARAPNIGELFQPPSQNFPPNLSDPCDVTLPSSTYSPAQFANVRRNCAAQGVPGNLVPTQADLQGISGTLGGNQNLQAETANTWTVGAVYSPSWLKSALLSVDYYRINIRRAIAFVGGDQETLDQCYTATIFPNNFCSLIVRNAPGIITDVNATQQNVAVQRTSGIDVELAYTLQLRDIGLGDRGDVNLRWNYTYLLRDERVPFSGADPQFFKDQVGHAKNKWNLRATYENDPYTVAWNIRYIGESVKDKGAALTDFNNVPAYWYHDVQGRWALNETVTAFVGVNNLFDRKPPFIPSPLATNVTGTETASDVYDPIGRFIYVGVDLKF